MSAEAVLPTLLTFAPMVDSELSRLVLQHHGVDYVERDHLFGWVSLLTLPHGGYGRTPLLYGRGLRLSGPREMVEHFDGTSGADRLLPLEEPVRTEVEEHWDRFNGEMAFDTAAIAYFHLLPQRELMIDTFAKALPAGERRLLPTVYGALQGLFALLLRLGPGHARDALARVRTRLAVADGILCDGRPWLLGDRLTLADLSLVSAAAPLVLPPGYGRFLPAFDAMPEPLRDIVEELRSHPSSALVARHYAEWPEP